MSSVKTILGEFGKAKAVPIEDPPEGYEALSGKVFMRRMSGSARDSWMTWFVNHTVETKGDDGKTLRVPGPNATHATARRVARALCDEQGVLEYDCEDEASLAELGSLDEPVLEWLDKAIRQYNSLGEGADEDAAKNSESSQS